jgi:hypothetical protein
MPSSSFYRSDLKSAFVVRPNDCHRGDEGSKNGQGRAGEESLSASDAVEKLEKKDDDANESACGGGGRREKGDGARKDRRKLDDARRYGKTQ